MMQILDIKVSLPTVTEGILEYSLRTGIGANVQEDVRMRELLKDMAQNMAQAYVFEKSVRSPRATWRRGTLRLQECGAGPAEYQ